MLYGGFPTPLSPVWETEDEYRGQGRTTRTTADGFSSTWAAPGASLETEEGGKWGRAVKGRQHSSFSCVFQFTSVTPLLRFCSAFVLFSFTSHSLQHLLIWEVHQWGLWSWEYSPSTFLSPGWVSKLLYWEEECDGLCVFPLPIAIRSSNQGDTAKPKPRSPVHLLTCLQFFVVFTCFLGLLKQQNKSSYKVAAARHQPRI